MIGFNDTAAAAVEPKPGTTFLKPEHLAGVSFIIKARGASPYGVQIDIAPVDQPFSTEKISLTFNEKSFIADQVNGLKDSDIAQGVTATFTVREGQSYIGKDGKSRESYRLSGVLAYPAPWPDIESIRAFQMAEKAQRDAEKAKASEAGSGDFPF